MDTPSPTLLGLVLLASALLAYVTWLFIEKPCRESSIVVPKSFARGSIIIASTLYLVGYLGTSNNGLEFRYGHIDDSLRAFYDESIDYGATDNACLIYHPVNNEKLSSCVSILDRPIVVLIGDSHAEALSDSIRSALSIAGYDLVVLIRNSCLPIPNTARPPLSPRSPCFSFNQDAYAAIEGLSPEYLILSSYWASNLLYENFDNEEGGRITRARTLPYSPTDRDGQTVLDIDLAEHISVQLNLLADKHRLVLISQIPETGWHIIERIRGYLMRYQQEFDITTSYDIYQKRNRIFTEIESQLDPAINVVNPATLVCETVESGRCRTVLNGKALYRDDNHPTLTFSSMIAEEITKVIAVP